ncbi:MAG: protein kinase [Pseudomonadota bacterium]
MKICPHCIEVFSDDSAFCPFHGTALEKSGDRWIGKVLNHRYRILEKIGEGGMGKVYKALQLHPERHVAIKIIPSKALKNPRTRSRFEREAKAIATIQHEHIVDIYDKGNSENAEPYIVMEYLDGEPLDDLMLKKRLSIDRIVSIMMQVCDALGPLHALGIIHRDLKPGNIILVEAEDGGDFVKLLDFGIAFLSTEPRLTETGIVVGTPEYMSPELVLAKPIGPPTDLYSLGCIAYEAICGRPPFVHKMVTMLLVMQVDKKPAPIENRAPSIPPGLARIVNRLLEKKPEDRHPDAYVLMKDLEALGSDSMRNRPTMAPPPGPRMSMVPMGAEPHEAGSTLWKKFVADAKTTALKKDAAFADMQTMEDLCLSMEKIESEQALYAAKIENIERENSEAKARLRNALNVLARELSEKTNSINTTERQLDDLRFQLGEISKRMESVDAASWQEIAEARNKLQDLEAQKLQIKEKLEKISSESGGA